MAIGTDKEGAGNGFFGIARNADPLRRCFFAMSLDTFVLMFKLPSAWRELVL